MSWSRVLAQATPVRDLKDMFPEWYDELDDVCDPEVDQNE